MWFPAIHQLGVKWLLGRNFPGLFDLLYVQTAHCFFRFLHESLSLKLYVAALYIAVIN